MNIIHALSRSTHFHLIVDFFEHHIFCATLEVTFHSATKKRPTYGVWLHEAEWFGDQDLNPDPVRCIEGEEEPGVSDKELKI